MDVHVGPELADPAWDSFVESHARRRLPAGQHVGGMKSLTAAAISVVPPQLPGIGPGSAVPRH